MLLSSRSDLTTRSPNRLTQPSLTYDHNQPSQNVAPDVDHLIRACFSYAFPPVSKAGKIGSMRKCDSCRRAVLRDPGFPQWLVWRSLAATRMRVSNCLRGWLIVARAGIQRGCGIFARVVKASDPPPKNYSTDSLCHAIFFPRSWLICTKPQREKLHEE